MTSSASSTNVITDADITPENAEAHADVSRSASFSVSGVAPNTADAISTPNPTPSCCSEEDESSSDSGGRSFLSWTQSRRSAEYIQSEKYHELLQQKQETPEEAPFQCTHHSSMQLYQQLKLQRLYPAKRSLLPVNGQSSRRISQESNASILSHGSTSSQQSSHHRSSQELNDSMSPSPTPFRSMLPREL